MEQLTLNDLYYACKKLVREGHGNKHLIVSGDNEGNSYHGMFYALSVITPDNKDSVIGLIGDSAEPNINNLIIVG